jgi:hypothetical protein
MNREELPRLLKTNILIKIPPVVEEDEMELANPDNDPEKVQIAAISKQVEENGNLKVGDEVIMQSTARDEHGRIIKHGAEPLVIMEVAGEQYAMFQERDVEGVWK